MAGSHGAYGGGTNYLCAPLDPQFNEYHQQSHHQTRLHGVMFGKVGHLFIPGRKPHINFSGVPCAVCKAPRTTLLMIPALNVCPSRHWTREYHGFLMAQGLFSSKTEYVCVDAEAQGVKLSNVTRVLRNSFLTPVKSFCAVLPCPPYRDDLELTCAVCTS